MPAPAAPKNWLKNVGVCGVAATSDILHSSTDHPFWVRIGAASARGALPGSMASPASADTPAASTRRPNLRAGVVVQGFVMSSPS